jgi:hypothetical protein
MVVFGGIITSYLLNRAEGDVEIFSSVFLRLKGKRDIKKKKVKRGINLIILKSDIVDIIEPSRI